MYSTLRVTLVHTYFYNFFFVCDENVQLSNATRSIATSMTLTSSEYTFRSDSLNQRKTILSRYICICAFIIYCNHSKLCYNTSTHSPPGPAIGMGSCIRMRFGSAHAIVSSFSGMELYLWNFCSFKCLCSANIFELIGL